MSYRRISAVRSAALAALILAVSAGMAEAHTGGVASGLAAGAAHPLSGLDHLLAMVAVGIWAVRLGGYAVVAIPSAFVVMMGLGALLGLGGIGLPAVEPGIAASLLVLGLLIATSLRAPVWMGALVVGLFALFHGHAHGAELPASISEGSFIGGFLVATTALHGLGIVLGRTFAGRFLWVERLAGAGVAAMGGALLFA